MSWRRTTLIFLGFFNDGQMLCPIRITGIQVLSAAIQQCAALESYLHHTEEYESSLRDMAAQ